MIWIQIMESYHYNLENKIKEEEVKCLFLLM